MAGSTTSATHTRTVLIGGRNVNRIGLGTNRITDTPEARALLYQAVELGVHFIDTAYLYTGGASEATIGRTVAAYSDKVVIATKGGWDTHRPEELRGFLETSLRRLQVDCIELYQLHRVNPYVPIEESVGMFKRFQEEGKIQHIGLSEVTVEQLERARKVAPITSVQNEYNIAVRKHDDVVDYCTERNIVFIPWFPLGGLRGDTMAVTQLVTSMTQKYGATPQQIALAWLLQRSPMMLPILGTLSSDHLQSNLKAMKLQLIPEDYDAIFDMMRA